MKTMEYTTKTEINSLSLRVLGVACRNVFIHI